MENLKKSLSNDPGGWSGRKLSAFAGVGTAILLTLFLLPESARLNALYAWLLFVAVCLGLVTAEQMIKLKNGDSKTETTKNSTITETKIESNKEEK